MEKERQRGLGFISGLLAGVVLTSLVVVLAFGIGNNVAGHSATNAETDAAGVSVTVEQGVINADFIKKLNTIETLIEEYYYLEEVGDEVLREGE